MVYLNDAAIGAAGAVSSFGSGLQAALVGSQLRLDLDEVVVPGAGTSDDALETTQFTITYSVRVDDVAAIQNGVNLVNDADASADGLPDDVDNQASVTVVEPDLLVTKSIPVSYTHLTLPTMDSV